MSDTVVTTKSGKIQGLKVKSTFSGAEYYAFYGIPYAQPPVGDLRFRDPVKIKPWKSIKDATSQKGGCAQISAFSVDYQGSEDCLYVNIYIPRMPKKGDPLLPVIACIPVGGLQCGSPDPNHQGSPDYIMHNDIIYVGISHRLHILGFMNLHVNECRGNMGLKDTIMAFEWIQENIKAFGGDPNNVTAIGSSSGAIMIHLFLLCPAIQPLFHKAIMMGDYVFNNVLKMDEDNTEFSFEFARTFGFNGDNPKHLLTFLKNTPVNMLVTQLRLYQSMSDKQSDYCKVFPYGKFLPTMDANSKWCLVPCSFRKLIPHTKKIPIIHGQCQKEAIMGFTKQLLGSTADDHFRISCRQNCWGWMHHLDNESIDVINNKIESFYYKDHEKTKPLSVQVDVISDTAFSEIYETVVDLIATECPVYVYKFEFEGELGFLHNFSFNRATVMVKGTYHSDDHSYWTKMEEPKITERSKDMVYFFTKLFVNFAITGNPNGEPLEIEWKSHSREHPCYLSINDTSKMIEGRLSNERAIFWDEIKKEFRKELESDNK